VNGIPPSACALPAAAAIPPLSHMPSWHGAQLKKAQVQFYLYLCNNSNE